MARLWSQSYNLWKIVHCSPLVMSFICTSLLTSSFTDGTSFKMIIMAPFIDLISRISLICIHVALPLSFVLWIGTKYSVNVVMITLVRQTVKMQWAWLIIKNLLVFYRLWSWMCYNGDNSNFIQGQFCGRKGELFAFKSLCLHAFMTLTLENRTYVLIIILL